MLTVTTTTPEVENADRVLCHCLGVTEGQVKDAVWVGACQTVKAVMDCTGAGSGCTACHCRIRELLAGGELLPQHYDLLEVDTLEVELAEFELADKDLRQSWC